MAVFERDRLNDQLLQGASALGVPVSDTQAKLLLDYTAELLRWNRAYNLTAITQPQQMVVRHLLDSLALLPLIDGQRLLDVGTGPGLPGMVLAIMAAHREHHLLDSNGKKTRFIFHVKTQLGLSNVTEHHCRIEQHTPQKLYNRVTSRAFASLDAMLISCEGLVAEGGSIVAMKGKLPGDEIAAIANLPTKEAWRLARAVPLAIPGLEQEQRYALILRREREID